MTGHRFITDVYKLGDGWTGFVKSPIEFFSFNML